MEKFRQTKKEKIIQGNYFPFLETKEEIRLDYLPELKEGMIYHSKNRFWKDGKELNRFTLQRTIGGHKYIFRIGGNLGDDYTFLFKTREYDYARVKLSPEDERFLWETIAMFIEAVSGQGISEINLSPADTSHYSDDIERCKEEILAAPENTMTREEIEFSYKGQEIFDLYYRMFNKYFLPEKMRRKSKAKARYEYFKIMFEKYLPNWSISTSPEFGGIYGLVLKKKPKS